MSLLDNMFSLQLEQRIAALETKLAEPEEDIPTGWTIEKNSCVGYHEAFGPAKNSYDYPCRVTIYGDQITWDEDYPPRYGIPLAVIKKLMALDKK